MIFKHTNNCLNLGISLLALYLELFSYTTMMSYNYYSRYAILSYLEYPMLLMQEYVLVFLVLKYNGMLNQHTYVIAGAYFCVFSLILSRLLPSFLFTMLVVSIRSYRQMTIRCVVVNNFENFCRQPFCTPIGATSKILQLVEIVRRKDSSSVSLTTWFLSAFTNLSK